MKVQFSAEALEDASEIFDYLESQQNSLGDEFFTALADITQVLRQNPKAFQKLEGEIKIITLIHHSRNPGRYPKP